MKNTLIRISIIFVTLSIGVLFIYTLICMSTFFVANFAKIPVIAMIAYGIASLLSIVTIAIVFKNIKKVGITLAILAGLTLITASVYAIIANFDDFKMRITSLISNEFTLGFFIAILLMGFSILANYMFFTKK